MSHKRRREYLTPEEIKKLLTAAKTASRNPVRDYAMLLMAFQHGLRVSELCHLKLSDIDGITKTVEVHHKGGGDSSAHEFYISESLAVSAWLSKRAKMNPPESCDTLFISERRKPMDRGTVWLRVKLTAEAAGLGHLEIHPHMLRHSCGYALVNKGNDLRVIRDYLGLQSVNSTTRYTAVERTQIAKLF